MFGVFIYFWQLPLFSVTNSQLLHSPEVLNFFSGFFTQLHKLRSLRRSFLHFHYYSPRNWESGELEKKREELPFFPPRPAFRAPFTFASSPLFRALPTIWEPGTGFSGYGFLPHVSGESSIRICNFLNPLSRVNIFAYAMNPESCGR